MKDELIKALAVDQEIRAYVVRATDLVETAREKQDTWHTATAALGRTLIGTLLLATSGLKNEADRLTVRVQGDGPARYLLGVANAKGEVKGFIENPHLALDLNEKGKLDVKGAVGENGTLTVVKDLGMKTPFNGQVELISGELAEDFTYYLAASEQTPSAVGLSVLVNPDESVQTAGGFLLQVLPHASETTISKLEKALAQVDDLSEWFASGMSLEAILEKIVGKSFEVIERQPVSWHCDCSKERFERALESLPASDIEAMIAEDGQAEAVCHFCGKKYLFTQKELEHILEKINKK